MPCESPEQGTQLREGGAATAELGRHPSGEDAPSFELRVVLVDEGVLRVVVRGAGGEAGPEFILSAPGTACSAPGSCVTGVSRGTS